jgi:hypothetical protein
MAESERVWDADYVVPGLNPVADLGLVWFSAGKVRFIVKVRLHYRAKSMLDKFARRVFDKFAPSKAAITAILFDA